MQVILKQNVARLGRYLDVVEVSDGYANNYLFPQKLAEPATKAKVAELEKRRESAKVKEEAEMKALREHLENIKESPLTITVKSDEQGNLYKKIGASDIAASLKESFDTELPETAILLDAPLDKTGEYEVAIEFAEIKTTLAVHIVREEK